MADTDPSARFGRQPAWDAMIRRWAPLPGGRTHLVKEVLENWCDLVGVVKPGRVAAIDDVEFGVRHRIHDAFAH